MCLPERFGGKHSHFRIIIGDSVDKGAESLVSGQVAERMNDGFSHVRLFVLERKGKGIGCLVGSESAEEECDVPAHECVPGCKVLQQVIEDGIVTDLCQRPYGRFLYALIFVRKQTEERFDSLPALQVSERLCCSAPHMTVLVQEQPDKGIIGVPAPDLAKHPRHRPPHECIIVRKIAKKEWNPTAVHVLKRLRRRLFHVLFFQERKQFLDGAFPSSPAEHCDRRLLEIFRACNEHLFQKIHGPVIYVCTHYPYYTFPVALRALQVYCRKRNHRDLAHDPELIGKPSNERHESIHIADLADRFENRLPQAVSAERCDERSEGSLVPDFA